jgi:signal transduction histidine kinase
MLSNEQPNRRATSKMRDLRPLDPFASIKIKLGVLVGSASTVCALAVWWGLHSHLATRYTLPLSVLLALVVTQLLARGMTSPLREMTAAAVSMARGDYSRRVRATSNDEVGELAVAFNRMAEDLASVDRQRRELVANVSHELRTPVSALRAVLENIVDGVSEPDPATLKTALLQTERLAGLVEQLLDLSRIEGGATALRLAPVRVRDFLTVCAEESAMSGLPVTFDIEVEPPDLAVIADRERLHQVLANLVDNATRHSPDGGTVWLQAHDDPSGIVLDVADEGPGIAPDDRARVFERFHRGGQAQTDGGTGLGLAIARWVVDLHGGTIRVVDTTVGCRIRVVLPRPPSTELPVASAEISR